MSSREQPIDRLGPRVAPSMVEMPSAVAVLKGVAESLDQMPKQQYEPKPRPTMQDEIQGLLDLASESVSRIYSVAEHDVTKVEEICKQAKLALSIKRDAVTRSMREYLLAVQVVRETTEAQAVALSNMVVHNDALGN